MSKNLPACPVEVTLMLISDRWKVLILRDLLSGTKRFGELKKIHWQHFAKGFNQQFALHGGGWTLNAQGICRSAT